MRVLPLKQHAAFRRDLGWVMFTRDGGFEFVSDRFPSLRSLVSEPFIINESPRDELHYLAAYGIAYELVLGGWRPAFLRYLGLLAGGTLHEKAFRQSFDAPWAVVAGAAYERLKSQGLLRVRGTARLKPGEIHIGEARPLEPYRLLELEAQALGPRFQRPFDERLEGLRALGHAGVALRLRARAHLALGQPRKVYPLLARLDAPRAERLTLEGLAAERANEPVIEGASSGWLASCCGCGPRRCITGSLRATCNVSGAGSKRAACSGKLAPSQVLGAAVGAP